VRPRRRQVRAGRVKRALCLVGPQPPTQEKIGQIPAGELVAVANIAAARPNLNERRRQIVRTRGEEPEEVKASRVHKAFFSPGKN
jgi:hypothetical protein